MLTLCIKSEKLAFHGKRGDSTFLSLCVLIKHSPFNTLDQMNVVLGPVRHVLADSCSAPADAFHINITFYWV